MKLKYNFEVVRIADKYCAVPVGDEAQEIHAIFQMNKEMRELMEILKEDITEDQLIKRMTKIYDKSEKVIAEAVKPIIEELDKAGVLQK